MSYTECKIGGVDMWVDPDNVGQNIRPFAKVVPSIDGTIFVNYLSQNPANLGYQDDTSISGLYLTTASMQALQELAKSRTPVKLENIPGVDDTISYLIMLMSQSPVKPAVIFPGDDRENPPVRHSYSLTLQKVSDL